MKDIKKIKEGKWLMGVCTGLAKHFNQNVWLFRAIFLLISAFAGVGLLAYIIVALLMGKAD
ncbi:MAG: PspC domain-containing protein [Faecalibacterium sp.]